MEKKSFLQAASDFLQERFPVEKMNYESIVLKKDVPIHKLSFAYNLGGLALFFFTIQVITGLLLIFYYESTVEGAHASVHYISTLVPSGMLIRNTHSWSSSLMIFCVLCHMLTAFGMKAFARPREITWLSGVLLLFIVFAFGLTGYLLPWNQIAVNATKVGLQTVEFFADYLPTALADLPRQLKEIIQGGASIGQITLSRFYALHVVALPIIILSIIAIHLFSIQLHGISEGVDTRIAGNNTDPDSNKAVKSEKFFPFFALKDLKLCGVVFILLMILSYCIPFESFFSFPLFQPFDALGATPEGIKPEWYFLFIYYPMEMLPFLVVMLALAIVVTILFLTPIIFKATSRKTLQLLAIIAAGYLLVITVFGEVIYNFMRA